MISKQELKECNEELDAEMKQNLQCESERKICHNETVSKNQTIFELQSRNAKITSELDSGVNEIDILKKQNQELKINAKQFEEERDAETEKSFRCQSENTSNLKLIQELQSKQSKMTSDLQDYKSTDADLVISKQELKECNEELEVQTKKNLQCDSEQKNCQDETVLKNAEILELKSKNTKIVSKHKNERSRN